MGVTTVGLGLPDGMAGWSILRKRKTADFTAFTRDPELKRDIAYLREKLPTKATAQDMLKDPRLQRMVLQAYGLDAQVGMTALMKKVLESDPTSTTSVAARMTDPRYLALAKSLNYGGLEIPAIPALASTAKVRVEGLGGQGAIASFTGRFGGVGVTGLDLSGAESRAEVAATLQAAFRKADGGRSDISVSALGMDLVFSDAQGRGTLQGASFATTGGATTAVTDTVAGRKASAASGGPKVKDGATVDQIVQLYTQSQFEAAVGANSDTLRTALYAKRTLPGVTNWYSVLGDQNLMRVVRTALSLPEGMVKVDVDRQVSMLKGRMDIKDFQDPAKLGKLLDRFVAVSAATTSIGSSTASGVLSLLQPLST